MDVPVANESKWLNFDNCAVVNIISGDVAQEDLIGFLNAIFCKNKKWPWQVRDLSNKMFLVRFPPWKNTEDLIELPAFNLREGITVKVTEWKGVVESYGELVEAWVNMKGSPQSGVLGKCFLKLLLCLVY